MIEHAPELVTLLLWALLAVGGLFVALAKWIADRLLKKLEGIEAAIGKTNDTLASATSGLRGELVALERRHDDRIVQVERRVSLIDERCRIYHEHDKD